MGIYPIGLSGEHLDNRQAAIAGLKRWQPVSLKREPDNAYDANAIRVDELP